MKRRLLAGAGPGLVLVVAFLTASLWPRPLLSDDLRFANDVVSWLHGQNIAVQQVAHWTHAPWPDTSHAATMLTGIGAVQVVVFDTENDARRLQITSDSESAVSSLRYRYRLQGWPGAGRGVAWEAGYPWFFVVYKNWMLVTADAATAQAMKRLTTIG
jgi:hypothetical protein